MKKVISVLIVLLILFLAATVTLHFKGCGGDLLCEDSTAVELPDIDDSLRMRIDTFLSAVPPCGDFGMMVYDITAQKEVYSYNKDSLMRPASCMKILTCMAVLRYIGADKKQYNRLYTTGNLAGDTLRGDLILKTQFDTSFNRDTLNLLVDTLKGMGIKHISGNVVIDMAFTEAMDHEEHWIIGDLRTRYMGLVLQGFPRMRKELMGALYMKGIKLDGGDVLLGKLNPAISQLVAENINTYHTMIEKALKVSSNINAEALLYPLGYIYDKKGNYRENGKLFLNNFLQRELNVIPAQVCNIDDGCGLCPNDRVTPELLVRLLIYAHNHKSMYEEVLNDMPLAGVDGTLYKRMHHPEIKGKLRGKTGTLTREGGVSSLAGYFIGKDDHLIAYSIINNGCGVEDGRAWQDEFCQKAFRPYMYMGKLEEQVIENQLE